MDNLNIYEYRIFYKWPLAEPFFTREIRRTYKKGKSLNKKLLAFALALPIVGIALTACDEISRMNPLAPPPDPQAFPASLRNVLSADSSTAPNSSNALRYPRLAVSLTGVHVEHSLGIAGEAEDCGHFDVTEWLSSNQKTTLTFDPCIRLSDEAITYGVHVPPLQYLTENAGYIMAMDDQWNLLVQTGGMKSPDYQPMGPHWTVGPQAAQFFVPPAFVPVHKDYDVDVHLINAFINYVGQSRSTSVNPRVWFYQVVQFN